MIDSLKDKHSTYFDAVETQNFNQTIRGNFEGIGAYVGKTQSGVIIRQTFDTSPAREAGLLEGDIITDVNTVSIVQLSLEDAVKKIR